MKPNWWEAGQQLQREWLAFEREGWKAWLDAKLKGSFLEAALEFDSGNPSPMAAYLRSDKPFGPKQRVEFADYLEGKRKQSKKRGRPRDEALHSITYLADIFLRQWKTRNKELGIANRGHTDAMRDESIRFVLEEFKPGSSVDPADVRELMDRPKERRRR